MNKDKKSAQKFHRKNFKSRRDGKNNNKRNMKDYRGSENYEQEVSNSKFNDPMWYAKNEQMLKDAASYSYNASLGSALPNPFNPSYPSITVDSQARAVPGVMGLEILPCPGQSINANSPANLAANNIYAYTRFMNSGAKNYDQADQMIYFLAMDSLYYTFNWAKRIYGYIKEYDQMNRYTPDAYAAIDRVDPINLKQNLADFRYNLNRVAAQISSFCVPGIMPFFIRHSWMFSNIYKDADSMKAQQYMFTPMGYYVYNEKESEFGGELQFKVFKQDMQYTDVIAALDEMLQALAYSEDIGVMSGDILKAYGQEKLFKLAAIPEDYTVVPTYNEEVLNQIHNSNIVPLAYTHGTTATYVEDLSITQDPDSGFLIWNPKVTTTLGTPSQLFSLDSQLINMPWDNVTPANTMVATRLLATFSVSGTNNNMITIQACGSEIVVARRYVTLNPSTGSYTVTAIYDGNEVINPSNLGNTQISLRSLIKSSNFDWHPLIPVLLKSGNDYTFLGRLGDINNYTTLFNYDLLNLHLTAVMSEFNIPQIGSF